MTPERKAFAYNLSSLLCGVWFLMTGWFWAYAIALVVAYPVGLAGLLLWYLGRRLSRSSGLNNAALAVLVLGAAVSLVALLLIK